MRVSSIPAEKPLMPPKTFYLCLQTEKKGLPPPQIGNRTFFTYRRDASLFPQRKKNGFSPDGACLIAIRH